MLAFLCFVMTIAIYIAAKKLYRRWPRVYLTPLLTVPVLAILLVVFFRIPFEAYTSGTKWISEMVGPATVALAVPLYKNIGVLKKNALTISISAGCGAVVAFMTSVCMSEWLKLNVKIMESMAPRSATTPIAMSISENLGGIPSITALFVIITGLLGMVLGPPVVRIFRITNDVARGVLFGTSSHNAGTAKAFEFGSVAGTIASIAMVLTAMITLCAAPLLMVLLR
ncbi:LrgB family protein [Paenibacillus hamazuiensis]|uniref:LrgB family protein n=1 Tax=Paenibacillus hamazuiensis TaxID=2936508 RepID=UPI00200E3C0F|nr:LrgB family protein [Paenibacillus hamazuiensis]